MSNFVEKLLENGYTKYKNYVKDCTLYQKCIYDGNEKKYFININEYAYSSYENSTYFLEVDLQFYFDEERPINISFDVETDTIEQIEHRCEFLFNALECINYSKIYGE